jgi:hypothetical protein
MYMPRSMKNLFPTELFTAGVSCFLVSMKSAMLNSCSLRNGRACSRVLPTNPASRVQTTEESSSYSNKQTNDLVYLSLYHNVHKKQPNGRPTQLGSRDTLCHAQNLVS